MKQQTLNSTAANEPKEIFSSKESSSYRKEIVCIVAVVKGVKCVHFTSGIISGINSNLWFPVMNGDLFKTIEDIMVINSLCNNVTAVEIIMRNNDTSSDYNVIFNALPVDDIENESVESRLQRAPNSMELTCIVENLCASLGVKLDETKTYAQHAVDFESESKKEYSDLIHLLHMAHKRYTELEA